MEVVLIDNHDSFTYNIAHMFNEHRDVNLQIITSDKVELEEIGRFDAIIFSPGPDIPERGNIMEKVLEKYKDSKSILGICLGLQAITLFFGGKIESLAEVVHGRTKNIFLTGHSTDLFYGIEKSFRAGLYHSWIASRDTLPPEILVTAESAEKRVMAIKHLVHKIEAVQFHPESIMTPDGKRIISNWLGMLKKSKS